MMKSIKYMGREYEVPDWARFIATDSDGDISVFELRPEISEEDEDGNGWWVRFGHRHMGRAMLVSESGSGSGSGSGWKDSLVKIEE